MDSALVVRPAQRHESN